MIVWGKTVLDGVFPAAAEGALQRMACPFVSVASAASQNTHSAAAPGNGLF